jgi:hypothetical protein
MKSISKSIDQAVDALAARLAEKYNIPHEDILEEWKSVSGMSGAKKTTKPKKLSPWIMFSKEYRKTVKEDHPDASFVDVTRHLSKKWKTMTPEEKQAYANDDNTIPPDIPSTSIPISPHVDDKTQKDVHESHLDNDDIPQDDGVEVETTTTTQHDDDENDVIIPQGHTIMPQGHDDDEEDDKTTASLYDDNWDDEDEDPQQILIMGFRESDFATMKINQLKDLCEKVGLPKTGLKNVLIQRLVECHQTVSGASST